MKSSSKGSYSFTSDPIKRNSVIDNERDEKSHSSRSFRFSSLLRRESSKRHEPPKTNSVKKLENGNNNSQSNNYNYNNRSSTRSSVSESALVGRTSSSVSNSSARTIVPENPTNGVKTTVYEDTTIAANATVPENLTTRTGSTVSANVSSSAKTTVSQNTTATANIAPIASNSSLDTSVRQNSGIDRSNDTIVVDDSIGRNSTVDSKDSKNLVANSNININYSLDMPKRGTVVVDISNSNSKIDSVNGRNYEVFDTRSSAIESQQADNGMTSLRSTRKSATSFKLPGNYTSESLVVSHAAQKGAVYSSREVGSEKEAEKSKSTTISSSTQLMNNKVNSAKTMTQGYPERERGEDNNLAKNGRVDSVTADFTSKSQSNPASNGTQSNHISNNNTLLSYSQSPNLKDCRAIQSPSKTLEDSVKTINEKSTILLSTSVSNNPSGSRTISSPSRTSENLVKETKETNLLSPSISSDLNVKAISSTNKTFENPTIISKDELKLELDDIQLSRDFKTKDKPITTSPFHLSLSDPFTTASSVSPTSPLSPRARLLVRPATTGGHLAELSPADLDDSYSYISVIDHTGVRDQIDRSHPFFSRVRYEDPDTTIYSSKGTVRGIQNRVKAGLSVFQDQPKSKEWSILERDRIVVYTTSVQVVRKTFIRCLRIRKILQTHRVFYEERDVFINKDFNRELSERLSDPEPQLPQLFADGVYIGDATEVERLNENGTLREIFKEFKKVDSRLTCGKCGGYRYIPCTTCNGSRKTRRNAFTAELSSLRCTACDRNGLIKCDLCDVTNINNSDNSNPNSNNESNHEDIIRHRNGSTIDGTARGYSNTTSINSELGSPLSSSSGIGSAISSGVGSGISSSTSSINSSGINSQDINTGDSNDFRDSFVSNGTRDSYSRNSVSSSNRSSTIIQNDSRNSSCNGSIGNAERKSGNSMNGYARNMEQNTTYERLKVSEEDLSEQHVIDTKL